MVKSENWGWKVVLQDGNRKSYPIQLFCCLLKVLVERSHKPLMLLRTAHPFTLFHACQLLLLKWQFWFAFLRLFHLLSFCRVLVNFQVPCQHIQTLFAEFGHSAYPQCCQWHWQSICSETEKYYFVHKTQLTSEFNNSPRLKCERKPGVFNPLLQSFTIKNASWSTTAKGLCLLPHRDLHLHRSFLSLTYHSWVLQCVSKS